jgi:hypothetical protein
MNESKEKKTPVFAVTLDGQRALDEVWKQALMRKMYFTKIPYRYWDILKCRASSKGLHFESHTFSNIFSEIKRIVIPLYPAGFFGSFFFFKMGVSIPTFKSSQVYLLCL